MSVDQPDRFYATRFRETDWNGIEAYIKHVREITGEVRVRREMNGWRSISRRSSKICQAV